MKEIIPPVEKQLLQAELTATRFIRPTNKAGNEIYDIAAHEAPNVMREIARLRELAFRQGGGGTGEEMDMDCFDTMDCPYRQLIVWNPDAKEIIGGYRYILGRDTRLAEDGQPNIVSRHMFRFTSQYIKDYMPYTTELGRAFVSPAYQTEQAGIKSIFALDNLWDGLGALVYNNPDIRYLIGKITIYPMFDPIARDLIYAYLQRFFPSREELVSIKHPHNISSRVQAMADRMFVNGDHKTNYRLLQKAVRERGETIPPLFGAYIGLTSTMQTFGTGINDEFGNIYDTGIMITFADILEEKKERYIMPYTRYKSTLTD